MNIPLGDQSYYSTMSNTILEMSQLKQITNALEERVFKADDKNRMQKEIFVEYIRIFQKLAQKLALLSNRINEQILSSQDPNDQAIGNIFQHLSNALLRMADCSRNVAVKAKNEVHDPMKLFCDNYHQLNSDLLRKLRSREQELTQKYQQLNRNKENYYFASEKLDKHKKGQSKAMIKIENGDLNELEKFNLTIKKITENIKNSEEQYIGSVNLVNVTLQETRRELNEMITSLTYNQESRMSFSRKSLISSIKILEDFTLFFDSGVEKKIEDSLKLIENQKSDMLLKKKLHTRIALLSNSQTKEEFVSYDDLIRQRRKKSLQEQYSYLNEIFNKVKEEDKEIINLIISPWFKNDPSPKKQLQSPTKSKKIRAKDIDECKQKILCVQPYSYYFIEEVYRKIIEMSSFYLKLADDSFLLLLNMFSTITNNLELIENTSNSALGIEFLYKMIQVSMRIIWKKNYNSNKGHPLELLCQHYGKKCKNLTNEIVLKKLFMYVQKKKAQKKTGVPEEKGMMNTLFKGFGAVMNRKKQLTLTDDENFNCLTEMTQIMANLLTPSEVSIPFLKSLLGKNQNSRSFDYLKSILLEKRDQQERQKIFFRTQVKGKKEEEMRKVIEKKKMAEYGIMMAAKRGFFGKEDLGLRLICLQLKNVHLEILSHLDIPTQIKWIHLIPLDKGLDYVEMKREVAEKSVPSAIEEIITLDVNRSLHNHGEYLNPTILHSLLRTYAYFHKDISYCQGMNYIAGYLYIKTRDEQEAYRIFEYLMEVRFKELFAHQFEILKVKMYQFERLLGIFHPEISDHFKKQVITPQCYIVSWIITLFASSYQYTMESYLIDLLWQRFIVFGWREFFRFVLSLFSLYKEELMELTYDKALHFLGEMGRNEMFLSSRKDYLANYPDNKVEEGMDQYAISQELLLNLEKQYKLT